VYGLSQFVHPAPWDVLWVEGGRFMSIGPANPFQIRIFSTLNSPGPAADFFAIGIILAMPLFDIKRLWISPFVGALAAALLLTLVRASWVALAVGTVVYLFGSARRVRALPFIGIYAVFLIFLVGALPALLGAGTNSDVVMSRFETLTDVGHDTSALARSREIADSFQQGLENPIGTGLGQVGASSALIANPESSRGTTLDSGYMARFLELGWLGFAAYLFVVLGGFGVILTSALRRPRFARKPHEDQVMIATAAALCAALIWSDAAGDAHLGLDGIFFWIAMGIGLRRLSPSFARSPQRGAGRTIAQRTAAAGGPVS
jgi:hypothetical protein